MNLNDLAWHDIDGNPVDPGPLRQRAQALIRMIRGEAAVAEAELAAQGIHPVCVVTGYLETEEDANRLTRLGATATAYGSRQMIGGSDYATYLFPDEQSVLGFAAEVLGWPDLPTWWRVTPTAQPAYDR